MRWPTSFKRSSLYPIFTYRVVGRVRYDALAYEFQAFLVNTRSPIPAAGLLLITPLAGLGLLVARRRRQLASPGHQLPAICS
jgi:hypothetical protein